MKMQKNFNLTLYEMYRALLHEQEDARDDVDEAPDSDWLYGYACGVEACVKIVRDHLLAEDTEDP